MEREGSKRAISTISYNSQSGQKDARDVGSYSLRQWLLEEGSQSCVSTAGPKPSCLAVGKNTGGDGVRGSRRLLKKSL
jgi:hypothetical protein